MRLPPLILALLLAFALAAPLAAAQAQPCSISTTQPASPQAIAPGERADLTLQVTNDGSAAATVNVTASVSTPGWTVVSIPPPAPIAASASATFPFVVEATGDATGDAVVQFAASADCQLPACAPIPNVPCSIGSTTANAQVSVPLQAREGLRFPVLDDLPVSPELLLAGIVLVGLAAAIPFAMRRKRGGVHAECPEPLKMVQAGRGASFPIEVRNAGREGTTATFDIAPVPEGWSAFMPMPEVQLAPRESRSLWLMVRAPATAAVGDAVEVELRLRDPSVKEPRAVRVRAEVQAGEA